MGVRYHMIGGCSCSLERKLTEKNAELADSKNELKTLQQKFDAHLRNEAEVKRKASQTSGRFILLYLFFITLLDYK